MGRFISSYGLLFRREILIFRNGKNKNRYHRGIPLWSAPFFRAKLFLGHVFRSILFRWDVHNY